MDKDNNSFDSLIKSAIDCLIKDTITIWKPFYPFDSNDSSFNPNVDTNVSELIAYLFSAIKPIEIFKRVLISLDLDDPNYLSQLRESLLSLLAESSSIRANKDKLIQWFKACTADDLDYVCFKIMKAFYSKLNEYLKNVICESIYLQFSEKKFNLYYF